MRGEGAKNQYFVPRATTPSDLAEIAVAAHELKGPLAVVRQLALELGDDSLSDTERQLIAQQIELIAERSLRFTSNITKVDQLALLETDPVNSLQVCDDVVRELRPLYTAHERVIRFRTPRRAPLVVANYDLLRRILLNFGDNALHYGDENGVVELFTELKKSRQVMRIGVRDYGPMLPADTWRRVSSTTVPRAVSSRPDSSGLGLKIVSQFAEAIGGRIGAVRHRDGASFYVELPLSGQLSLL